MVKWTINQNLQKNKVGNYYTQQKLVTEISSKQRSKVADCSQ